MIEEHLALPFSVRIMSVEAVGRRWTLRAIVEFLRAASETAQRIEILDLPLPKPIPAGSECIAASSHWRRGF
jgi:hypothetical protein